MDEAGKQGRASRAVLQPHFPARGLWAKRDKSEKNLTAKSKTGEGGQGRGSKKGKKEIEGSQSLLLVFCFLIRLHAYSGKRL
jgi:hypothetical protein